LIQQVRRGWAYINRPVIRRRAWYTYGSIAFVIAAIGASTHSVHAGLFTDVEGVFGATTGPLEANAQTWALRIFYTLVPLEFTFTAIESYKSDTMEALLKNLGWRIGEILLGLMIVLNLALITDGATAAIQAIATSFTFNAGNPLSSDGIASLGWDRAGDLAAAMPQGNVFQNIALAICEFITACGLMASFSGAACENSVIHVGTTFLIAIGGILTGLLSSRFTRPLASTWGKMLYMTFILNVTIGAITGMGNLMSAHFVVMMQHMNGFTGAIQNMASIFTSSGMFMLFVIGFTALAAFLGAQSPISVAPGIAAFLGSRMGAFGGSSGGGAGSSSDGAAKEPIGTIEAAAAVA
jgi:hypothetical protein